MKQILIFCCIILFFGKAHAEENLETLLPDISVFKSLSVAQAPTQYAGFDLFTMINGGAEVYFEYGFEKALNLVYLVNDKSRMEVQIYEMSDVGAAYGIFSHSKVIMSDVSVKNSVLSILSDYYRMIQKDRYFIILSWGDPLSELSELATALGDEIAAKIKSSGPLPDIVSQRLDEDYTHSQIKYIRGTIALSATYFFSHRDPFSIREAVCTEDAKGKTILFQYDNPEQALASYNAAREDFSISKRFINYSESNGHIHFTDKRGRVVQIWNEQNMIRAEISAVNKEDKVISLPDGF